MKTVLKLGCAYSLGLACLGPQLIYADNNEVIEAFDRTKDISVSTLNKAERKIREWKTRLNNFNRHLYDEAEQSYEETKAKLKAYNEASEPHRQKAKEELRNSWEHFRKSANELGNSLQNRKEN